MKTIKNLAVALTMILGIGAVSTQVFASGTHSHSHGELEKFDPTESEFGMYHPDMKPNKTVEIRMADTMMFSPNAISVEKGDIVLFKHTNNGAIMHEFVLGTPGSLDEHAEMMKKFPGMEHEEPYMLHVAPGKTGQILWKFSESGTFAFACLIPGHYEAGMKGSIVVKS
ncbi:MAG: putative cupredoxin-like copper-binding protein [Parasphingorhabdus sp.]|jgi:uncharacterized cupredoxin-like copper-binding protein